MELNNNPWLGVQDKSLVHGLPDILGATARLLLSYPTLLFKFVTQRRSGDIIMVPYLGQFDVIALCVFARLFKHPIVLDIFISLYDTVVDDRRMMKSTGIAAKALWIVERFAITRAELALLDTASHARRVEKLYRLKENSLSHVMVGAEDALFMPQRPASTRSGAPLKVLFYGQLSPLHGLTTILSAAAQLADCAIDWTIVGTGQDTEAIESFLASGQPHRVTWIKWVPYSELPRLIASSDVCLGIFGGSDKAASVIPNKVFQIASVGRYVVTRDGPGIRELFGERRDGISIIPPEDPKALADAVWQLLGRTEELRTTIYHDDIRPKIGRWAVGMDFAGQLHRRFG